MPNLLNNPTLVGIVDGTPGTMPTDWDATFSGGLSKQIVGHGIVTGLPYMDFRYFGTAAGGSTVLFFSNGATHAAASLTYDVSFYYQLIAGTKTNTTSSVVGVNALDSGAVYLSTPVFAGIGDPAGSLTRYDASAAMPASTAFVQCYMEILLGTGAVDITIRIAGVQFELGSVPTIWNDGTTPVLAWRSPRVSFLRK